MGRKVLGCQGRAAAAPPAPGAGVGPTVRKRFYGQQRPQLGPEAPRQYRDDDGDPLDVAPEHMAKFRRWFAQPKCRAQMERHADFQAMATAQVINAASFAICLATLLAYHWLRLPRVARVKVAWQISAAAAPDWQAVHAELFGAERQESGRPSIRRGHGPWKPQDLTGLSLPQRELAALRGWHALLTAETAIDVAPWLQSALRPAPDESGSSPSSLDASRILWRLPGVGNYLAAKVLYGLEALDLIRFDAGVVGPGAAAAAAHLCSTVPLYRQGAWPWQACAARRFIGHCAATLEVPWFFLQVALCIWKMGGFQDGVDDGPSDSGPGAAAPTAARDPLTEHSETALPRRRVLAKRPVSVLDTSPTQELRRRVVRAAFACTAESDDFIGTSALNFAADATWAALTAWTPNRGQDIDLQVQAGLQAALQLHGLPDQHPMAKYVHRRLALYSSPPVAQAAASAGSGVGGHPVD